MAETVNLDPLINISHQDIQQATEDDLGLTAEQLNQINNQLNSETQQTVYVQPPPPALHYQLQGTWQTPGGKYVNYIILKDSMESKVDISRIYFNMEDINKCRGFNLDLTGANDRFHLNLLNIILEFPNSEIVLDLFKDFIAALAPLASTQVHESVSTPLPTIIESKGPKIQLKVEGFCLNSDLLEHDTRDSFLWQEPPAAASSLPANDNTTENISSATVPEKLPPPHFLQPKTDKSSDKKVIGYNISQSQERKEKMTSDEKRFFEVCRNLGQRPVRKDHFLMIGTMSDPCALCMHCKARFTAGGGIDKIDKGDEYSDTIRQVVDHVLVQHFQTFAYKCDQCAATFNTKDSFEDHMKSCHAQEIAKFQCKDCSVAFYSKKDLKTHEKLAHEASDTGLSLKCKSCSKTFSSKKTMHAHMRGIHGISSKTPKKAKANTTCQICGENKKSEHNLMQHYKKFHENPFPEPISCKLCVNIKQLRNRKYHTPYALNLHEQQIHSGGGEGKLVCEYCCREFHGSIGKVKFALKEHIQAVHLGIRKECDECGKTFISNIVLNKHKKHVHRREAQYPCKGCGKIFRYSQQAIDHEYKDKGITPYECKNCNYKTSDNWALAKHKKTCLSIQISSNQVNFR